MGSQNRRKNTKGEEKEGVGKNGDSKIFREVPVVTDWWTGGTQGYEDFDRKKNSREAIGVVSDWFGLAQVG